MMGWGAPRSSARGKSRLTPDRRKIRSSAVRAIRKSQGSPRAKRGRGGLRIKARSKICGGFVHGLLCPLRRGASKPPRQSPRCQSRVFVIDWRHDAADRSLAATPPGSALARKGEKAWSGGARPALSAGLPRLPPRHCRPWRPLPGMLARHALHRAPLLRTPGNAFRERSWRHSRRRARPFRRRGRRSPGVFARAAPSPVSRKDRRACWSIA